jgi:hypothetical protein
MAPSASEVRRATAALLLLLAATSGAAQDAYPTDITPPPGTRYPCALTALPRGLPGIPEADRAYVNHSWICSDAGRPPDQTPSPRRLMRSP